MIEGLHWLGHDSFRIDAAGVSLYIDPWKLPANARPADLVLVTHDHYDHFSAPDIERVVKPGTVVVGPSSVTSCLTADADLEVVTMSAGETISIGDVKVTAVAAYNTNKFREPGVPYHPAQAGYLGYVVEVGGRRIYHAGDTDIIPEMSDVHCDIALMPVSGTYTMTAAEAANACETLDAGRIVPMHFGDIIGSIKDAHRFAELCRLPVTILPVEHW